MSVPRAKRVIFSDNDMNMLVDLVYKYKHIIECKKTDALTWKDKDATWIKISDAFNASVMEKKTPEQLRTKYDNLKKDARRYFAKQRQDIYRTGGGVIENVIRDILKHIFEKIRVITTLSMEGIEPPVGDSDFCSLSTSETSNFEETSKSVAEAGDDDQHFTQPLNDKMQDVEGIEVVYVEPCVEESVASTPANDWSTYTPTMLRTKKQRDFRHS
ncbi:myb/SANT-like DNA-binding domain-containing protein 3 [Photinus pyralis]|uniref:myb/SANT-like DNA-binding domain-containing protein 3 n=1 Tax=Photinus pyralis TaxID=7054 RepID=UPI0012671058|nr:myb/SANT-like DNA-binding domain-containing protein 3 [Photinus pyralis]